MTMTDLIVEELPGNAVEVITMIAQRLGVYATDINRPLTDSEVRKARKILRGAEGVEGI